MTDNIFLKSGKHSEGPWRLKRIKSDLFVIEDLYGNWICRFEKLGPPGISPEQYRHNMSLIAAAPQLLAALKEAGVNEVSEKGCIQPKLKALIESAQNDEPLDVKACDA